MIRNAALPDWRAKWIDPELPHDAETRQPASYLRKRFFMADPADACLYGWAILCWLPAPGTIASA